MASQQTQVNGGAIVADSIQGNGNALAVGRTSKVMAADANDTLTAAQCAAKIIEVTSGVTITATRNITLPALVDSELHVVANLTTGSASLQFLCASGTGVTVAQGKRAMIYCDGTNVVRATPDV